MMDYHHHGYAARSVFSDPSRISAGIVTVVTITKPARRVSTLSMARVHPT